MTKRKTASPSSTVTEVILKVTTALDILNNNRYALAKILLWARHVVNWYRTEYGSWGNFCDQYINMSSSSIHRYLVVAKAASDLGYTDTEVEIIIQGVGWHRFTIGVIALKRKILPTTFISRFKDIPTWGNTAKTDGKGQSSDGDRAYTFSLPREQADILDGYLTTYGMTYGPGGRRGVRDAMITLISRHLDSNASEE